MTRLAAATVAPLPGPRRFCDDCDMEYDPAKLRIHAEMCGGRFEVGPIPKAIREAEYIVNLQLFYKELDAISLAHTTLSREHHIPCPFCCMEAHPE